MFAHKCTKSVDFFKMENLIQNLATFVTKRWCFCWVAKAPSPSDKCDCSDSVYYHYKVRLFIFCACLLFPFIFLHPAYISVRVALWCIESDLYCVLIGSPNR